jgi:hypothetical protein
MKLLILLISFTFTFSYAQELTRSQLDSLYNLYVRIKTPVLTDKPLSFDTTISKCGFSYINLVRTNYDKFTPEQKAVLQKIFTRPTTQKNIVSPRGWFRVHYDTSGFHAIKYDLNLLLEALDSSYSYQVLTLGYPPPKYRTTGGNDKYDVYVQSIVDYGYTEFEETDCRHSDIYIIYCN